MRTRMRTMRTILTSSMIEEIVAGGDVVAGVGLVSCYYGGVSRLLG